jgi:hypothetical protein
MPVGTNAVTAQPDKQMDKEQAKLKVLRIAS